MARPCSACGLPLDPEHHDEVRFGKMLPVGLPRFKNGRRIRLAGPRRPRRIGWLCRVKFVATNPVTGEDFDAEETNLPREKESNARYVRV